MGAATEARRVRAVGAAVATLLLVVGLAPGASGAQGANAAQAPGPQTRAVPVLTGQQFKDFYDRYEPAPGTTRPAVAPAITGNAAADKRIRSLAEGRGYRLRSLHAGRLVTVAGVPIDERVAGPFSELIAEARRNGMTLGAGFGYRSVDYQRTLFLRRIPYSAAQIAAGQADGSIIAALRWVAAPGYSKHHSGFTLDLRAAGGAAFGSSAVGRWLAADNYAVAKRHGFIPNYPPGTGPQGPEPEPWEYAWVGVPAITCSLHLARDNDRAAFDDCATSTPISRKYAALGGRGGILGAPKDYERAIGAGPNRRRTYVNGNIYATPARGALAVYGAIFREYARQGGIDGSFGYPVIDPRKSSDNLTRYSTFERGRIYATFSTGATVALPDPFFRKHEATAGIFGPLGYPTANAKRAGDGRSIYVNFQKGRIYAYAGRTLALSGPLYTYHESIAGVRGPLGYPTSDVLAVGDKRGQVAWFEGGYAWTSAATGPHGLWGDVVTRYLANGHAAGYLGYPTSDTTPVGDGRGTTATFERGRIYAAPGLGGHQVHGSVLAHYLAQGGPTGALGYPTSELDPQGLPAGRFQSFEHGRLQVLADGSVVEV